MSEQPSPPVKKQGIPKSPQPKKDTSKPVQKAKPVKQLIDKAKRKPTTSGKMLAGPAKAIKKKQNKGLDKIQMPSVQQGTGINPIENLGYR